MVFCRTAEDALFYGVQAMLVEAHALYLHVHAVGDIVLAGVLPCLDIAVRAYGFKQGGEAGNTLGGEELAFLVFSPHIGPPHLFAQIVDRDLQAGDQVFHIGIVSIGHTLMASRSLQRLELCHGKGHGLFLELGDPLAEPAKVVKDALALFLEHGGMAVHIVKEYALVHRGHLTVGVLHVIAKLLQLFNVAPFLELLQVAVHGRHLFLMFLGLFLKPVAHLVDLENGLDKMLLVAIEHLDEKALDTFEKEIHYAYGCLKLEQAEYQALLQWLEEERSSMDDNLISKDVFEKTLYGFSYEENDRLQYVSNAQREHVYERLQELESAGRNTTPVYSRQYWYNYVYRLSDVLQEYKAHLRQHCSRSLLEDTTRMREDMPAEIRRAGLALLDELMQQCTEGQQQTVLRYAKHWGILTDSDLNRI